MADFYHTSPSEFRVGARVQIHPGTDTWMRGDRFGTVAGTRPKHVLVKMDVSGKALRVPPTLLSILDYEVL